VLLNEYYLQGILYDIEEIAMMCCRLYFDVQLGQPLLNVVEEALAVAKRSTMEHYGSFLDLEVESPLETMVEEALAAAK